MAATLTKTRTQSTIQRSEIISLQREGHTNDQIAERLGCTEGTVRYHVKAWVASKEPPAERAIELREQWYDRIEFAHQKNWPGVVAGDPDAIAVLLKLETAAAKLMGLDLQQSIHIGINVSAEAIAQLFNADQEGEGQRVIEGTAVELEAGDAS